MKLNSWWTRWSLVAATMSVAGVSPVLAQDTGLGSYANPISFGIFGGGSVPLGDFKNDAGTGWHVGGVLQWNSPSSPFGFRFDGAYHKFGDKGGLDTYPSIVNGTINGLWTFPMASSTVRPYLIAGAGIYNERCSGCNSQTKPGINGGGGITVPLSGFSTIIEARFHLVFDSQSATGSSPAISNTTFIPISVGLLFR